MKNLKTCSTVDTKREKLSPVMRKPMFANGHVTNKNVDEHIYVYRIISRNFCAVCIPFGTLQTMKDLLLIFSNNTTLPFLLSLYQWQKIYTYKILSSIW